MNVISYKGGRGRPKGYTKEMFQIPSDFSSNFKKISTAIKTLREVKGSKKSTKALAILTSITLSDFIK